MADPLPVVMNILNLLARPGDHLWAVEQKGKAWYKKLTGSKKNLSGDKSLKAHAGTHLLYWM